MSQTAQKAYERAIQQIEKFSSSAMKSVSKGPGALRKFARNATLAASNAVQAATTAGAVAVSSSRRRKVKGGARKTRRMTRRKF
jgi:hypothetical protein